MNISSKSKKLFDTMLIGLLVLIGVYLVGGVNEVLSDVTNITTNYSDAAGNLNWTISGLVVNVTFTINATGNENTSINNITIKVPANFTFIGGATNYTGEDDGGLHRATNFTVYNFTSRVPGEDSFIAWYAGNFTYNDSNAANPITAVWQNLSIGLENGTGGVFVAEFQVDSGISDTVATWTIYTGNNDSASENVTTSTFDMGIDAGVPDINGITVTDGTNTLTNATEQLNGTPYYSGLLGDMLSKRYLGIYDPEGTINVSVTITDVNVDTVLLFITTDDNNVDDDSGTNMTYVMETFDNVSYAATVNVTGNITGKNVNFMIWANDTLGNDLDYNSTAAGIGGGGYNFSLVKERPLILSTNNSILDNFRYTGTVSLNVSIWANGSGGIPRVYYRYENESTNGPWVEMSNSSVWYNNLTGSNSFLNCDVNSTENLDTCNYTNFTVSIDTTKLAEGTHNLTFKVTNEVFTNTSATSDDNALVTTVLNFTVDNLAPSRPTITLSATAIEVQNSVVITCSGSSDAAGSPFGYYIWVKKPGALDYVSVHSGSSKTYSDTGTVGTYGVRCEAKDDLVHSSYRENTVGFTTTYSTAGTGSGTGTSGGGGAAAEAAFDVDLSGEGLQSETIKGTAGTSKTLSFDGSTTHTVTVTAVTEDSATITIESDPIEITLNVGESQEVDVNGDGVNDLNVELKAIEDAEAEVEITELEGAETVAEEEVKAAEEAAAAEGAAEEGVTPTEEEGVAPAASKTWIWVTAVIIVLVIVGIAMAKKKKK